MYWINLDIMDRWVIAWSAYDPNASAWTQRQLCGVS